MCASFQLIVPYTSHWTWGVCFYEDSRNFSLHFLMETRKAYWRNIQRIFCSYSPLRMRSAFGKKSKHFFEKLSSHFTTEDLRAVWAKKRKTFLIIFSVHTHHWRSIACLAENCWFFLSSLTTGHEKWVWEKEAETFWKIFLFPLPTGGEMPKWSAFREIFRPHLHGKNVNLLSSTTHWRKSGCLNEKSELLSKSFSHWSIWTRKSQLAEKIWK